MWLNIVFSGYWQLLLLTRRANSPFLFEQPIFMAELPFMSSRQALAKRKRSLSKDSAATSKKKLRARKDVADTYGVRGTGGSWQANFGMPLDDLDLLFAVLREPVASRTVFQVAHDIFDKGFTIEEVSEKPNPDWSREVTKVLDEVNAKAVLTQAVIYERLFGWSILAYTYVDYGKEPSRQLESPREIRELLAYSKLECNVQSSDEDKKKDSSRYGLPVLYTLGIMSQKQIKLHFSRAFHCATRLLGHPWKGLSVLEIIYDDMTVFRNERWGLGQTLFRYGSGFPDVTVQGAKTADLDDLEESQHFKNLQARTYFLHSDKTTLEFKGVAGRALNPEPYIAPVIESLSCGTGIPAAVLRGAQAGALTGSEVNEREYFKFISSLQTLYEPMIWDLVDRLMETGQISKVEDYKVVWLSGIELSEKDKAAVKLELAQARFLMLNWMTVDEVRADAGLDPLPNDAGKIVKGLQKPEEKQPPQLSSEAVSEGDVGLISRLISKLRRKKQDENNTSKQG